MYHGHIIGRKSKENSEMTINTSSSATSFKKYNQDTSLPKGLVPYLSCLSSLSFSPLSSLVAVKNRKGSKVSKGGSSNNDTDLVSVSEGSRAKSLVHTLPFLFLDLRQCMCVILMCNAHMLSLPLTHYLHHHQTLSIYLPYPYLLISSPLHLSPLPGRILSVWSE